MKQIFQIISGILCGFILFKILTLFSGKVELIASILSSHPIAVIFVLFLFALYLFWIRKAHSKQGESLVSIASGSYGHIGDAFDRKKLDNPKRVHNAGLLFGIRTYRAEDGSLLFTVRRRGTGNPLLRTVISIVLILILLVPLPIFSISVIDSVNDMIDSWLQQPSISSFTAAAHDGFDKFTGWLFHIGGSGDKYILPSDSRLITDSDIQNMDITQIQRAINEIYARHGCVLASSVDQAYFESQDWYSPNPDLTPDQAQQEFSDIELKNVNFLAARRNQLKS